MRICHGLLAPTSGARDAGTRPRRATGAGRRWCSSDRCCCAAARSPISRSPSRSPEWRGASACRSRAMRCAGRARRTSRIGRRACCRAASSSGSRSPAPGRCSRRCCFSTNRPPTSTRRATREIENVIQAIHAAGTKIVHRHPQPRAGAAPFRRDRVPRPGPARRARVHRAVFSRTGDGRGRRLPRRRTAMALNRRILLACALSRPLPTACARAGQVDHGRVDHLHRAIGPVRAHPARRSRRRPASRCASSRSARDRRST